MKLIIDELLTSIFEQILAENKTDDEWAEIESDDMFQNRTYVGGYDADEEAFCFSFYADEGEYWFQLTLDEIKEAVKGTIMDLELEKADL